MKETFEKAIKSINKEELSPEDTEAVEMIEKYVDEDTMTEIQRLQLTKLDLVRQLKDWRKKFWNENEGLDTSLEERPGAKNLKFKDGAYQVFLKGASEPITLTKGEVMSAGEWGVWWKFDDSVPREDQTDIMSKQVRALIAAEYDKQLIEYGIADTLSDNYKQNTYQAIKDKNLSLDTMPSGIMAEKMITSLLIKQMHDNPELAFRLKSADVYEDVEHKIDFILELKDHVRGVEVGEPHAQSFGIQFTLNPEAVAKKEQQIDRVKRNAGHEIEVDDIMLVTMPINDVKEKFDAWLATAEKKRDPRGPDHLWSEETKQAIIAGLLKRIETPH